MDWKYKVINFSEIKGVAGFTWGVHEAALENVLDKYNNAGWKLVSIFTTNRTHSFNQDAIYAIFRRPKD